MKILITSTAYPPSVGGAQTNLHQLSRYLQRDHQVKVASFWSANRTDWLLGTTWRASGGLPYQIDGIDVSPLNYSRCERLKLSPYVLSYYFLQSVAIDRIAETLLPKLRKIAGSVDLIHHGRIGREPLGFASLKLARELGVPFVLSAYHHPRWNNWLYRNYHSLYRQADAIIALSESEKDILIQLGVQSERIYVTGHGAVLSESDDAVQFRRQYSLTGPVVLFLGQKYAYKGIDKLLEAAPQVWDRFPETKFVFIGPRTAYSEKLFQNVTDDRIIELGIVDLETKTSALAASDILCLPSSQECFGGVIVEAWKMGKPVIGTNIPALAELISNDVDGFTGPKDPAYLAEKIQLLIGNPSLAQRMGRAGQNKVCRSYEWPGLAQQMADIYSGLVNEFPKQPEVSAWN